MKWCFTVLVVGAFVPMPLLAQIDPYFSQTIEPQPSVVSGAVQEKKAPSRSLDFRKGPMPEWIWGPSDDATYIVTTKINGPVQAAQVIISCDNVMTASINGKRLASNSEWQSPSQIDLAEHIKPGENTLSIEASNQGGVAALLVKAILVDQNGKTTYLNSNTDWSVVDKATGEPVKVSSRGKYGANPWGNVLNNAEESSGVPRDTFVVLPGFEIEKLYAVPKDLHGSWVCITTDPRGRIIASDQGGKGIFRIIPPAIATSKDDQPGYTKVEKLDIAMTSAQGMLHAFGYLYFVANGGPGSGLYRAKYDEASDGYGAVEKLKAFRGGGEHGPHAIRLSPDGQSLFVIAGNHTDPPFKAGEDKENEDYSSRIPTNWGEDLLLPRQWDANGHARGKLAPGGWIAKTDPDGKTWDIFSIGYRNPYDMDFNADGELFAYDADMEWDYGAPWYRPTRVVHATSGSEFGWRSGTGKWPTDYPDTCPPMVNIGPGSPVGVEFGYGTKFPAKYQKALYICDWTFGTMYAIHIKPSGSSYTATKEEFLSRTPLPLTDVTVGHDGALYFTIGGRGTQSELFRVVYRGDAVTDPVDASDGEFADDRVKRHDIESFHASGVLQRAVENNDRDKLRTLFEGFRSDDQRMRYSANVAALNGSVRADEFAIQALDEAEDDGIITIALTQARRDNTDAKELLLQALQRVDFDSLSESQQLDYLRALSLVWIRLGEATDAERQTFLKKLDPEFPTQSSRINLELAQTLIYLQSDTIVSKAVPLMSVDSPPEDSDYENVLARNGGYGRAVRAVLDNQPDKPQLHYAFALRNAKNGWTPELRKDYFTWFTKARTWSGGNSFQKFLQNIDNEAYLNAPENERITIEASGARTPFKMPELPKPVGPGQDWTLEQVRELANTKLKDRDFKNGKAMFAATRCILCHRFNGDGGATGPDLTQLAGRFNVDALTEAIMDPSKVISDQYRSHQVITARGKVLSGRIVSETDSQFSILVDPEDSTKVVDVPRGDVEEMQPSPTSMMPKDLLKPLNEDELLDLMAYLLSRGNENNGMFKKPTKK